ncbi:hypothetical protein TSTA_117320 [Talaromyces stipitatus ATCC 10500]|uniref:Uncharacterized protein n=1 Tax=Talaromyces stipitatus (strain ATCC 10500 / CBS 375.48 / QM 6759 / NRRL 1006) TaxID=441959 RepID=B8MDI4_TALSN|nr:uncharacterized protein TSTA_117320 [Talaromyces stipitatus ATCC 10500]EED17947.1 hypothetical protein TSTA_117320 [Talaromyces stipitatus ATCC 10500]
MNNYSVVNHVASSFFLDEKVTDGQKEVVELTLQGPQHVLEQVQGEKLVTSIVGVTFDNYADGYRHVLRTSFVAEWENKRAKSRELTPN